MDTDTPIIVIGDNRVPLTAPVAWYKRPLVWLRLIKRKPLAVWNEAGVLLTHPSQVDTVVRIFQEEGYTVIAGRARVPAAPGDRARWAAAPKPAHNFNKPPKVTRPNLRPITGGDKP